MKLMLPLSLAVVLVSGCAKDGRVGSMNDPGVVAVDFTPDIDLPDVDMPDVDMPSVNLPDVDLPDVDLPDMDRSDRSRRSRARTTDVAARTPRLELPTVPAGVRLDGDALSAYCPPELADAKLDVRETSRGVELTFTTRDEDDVAALRRLGARIAMDHTVRWDDVPNMTQMDHIVSGTTADGRAFTVTTGRVPRDGHRSHAVVVGVEDGVRIVIEPRQDSDVGMIQSMGHDFANRLAQSCDVAV